MPNQENPFLNGQYHTERAGELIKFPGLETANWQALRRGYRYTEMLMDQQEWEPLLGNDVRVLQMGIEGYRTADTFIKFIHSRNPQAVVTVADFSPIPLKQCIDNGIARLPNVNLVQADTTDLQFPDNSFNLIETDGLLQFLSPAEKRKALAEWYRVLKPGGVVTTRDRFAGINHPREWDDLTSWKKALYKRLGADSYQTSLEVTRYLFTEQGFHTTFSKMYPDDRFGTRRVIYGIAARKPEV